MKKQLLAVCLAMSAPMLAACATTGAQSTATFGDAAAYQQAQADVTRLTAQANQDPLLKPWTGQYGGVPPRDQARAELMPAALGLGVEQLVLSGRGGWQLALDNGAWVELGRGSAADVVPQVQRFVQTLTQVAARHGRRVDALAAPTVISWSMTPKMATT